MDAVWPRRQLWRRRGAWLWPVFVAATTADAVLGHLLPLSGSSTSVAGAALTAMVLNLIGVVLLSRPVGMLVRRARPDMPPVVARDYGGTIVVAALVTLLLALGLAHHAAVVRESQAMADAVTRAEAYIGDHAPAEFRAHMHSMSAFAIQPGEIYRACAPGPGDGRTYCVIVDERVPFPGGVRFGGYEPNSLFALGVN
jgi:hypothetical protein